MKQSLSILGAVATFSFAWSALGSSNKDEVKVAQVAGSVSVMPLKSVVYHGRLRDEDANKISGFRQAGIRGDASALPALRQALEKPRHMTYVYTSLHALAQLGDTDALPSVNKLGNNPDEDVAHFAVAAKARLLAEKRSKQVFDQKTQVVNKTERFYSAARLTPDDMNAGVLAYSSPKTTPEGYTVFSTNPGPTPTSVYALRELADMIYRDSLVSGYYQDYMALPEVAKTNFSLDYASALKMRFAPLPHDQRVSLLVDELSKKKSLRAEDDYEIQLVINEGELAVPVIADRLSGMTLQKNEYHYMGFAALFRVLSGIGDPNTAPLIEPFLRDQNTWVSYYANQSYGNVQKGTKRDRIQAY